MRPVRSPGPRSSSTVASTPDLKLGNDLGLATTVPALSSTRRLHPAWTVAAVTFVAILGAAGIRATPGILILPLQEEFGWDRGLISVAIGVNLLLFGLTAPFAAAPMERFGVGSSHAIRSARKLPPSAPAPCALSPPAYRWGNAASQHFDRLPAFRTDPDARPREVRGDQLVPASTHLGLMS